MPMTHRQLVAIAFVLGVAASPAAMAQALEAGDTSKGRMFAQEACAQCHGVLPDEVVSPRFNVASFKRIANTPGMTQQALSIWLTTSHPTMPNFILELEDRRNVAAYIVILKDK